MAFMTHPLHGATNTQDVGEHLKNGWVVSAHDEWMASNGKGAKLGEKESPPEAPVKVDGRKTRWAKKNERT